MLLQVQRAKQLLDKQILRSRPLIMGDSKNRQPLVLSLRHKLRWFANEIHLYLTFVVLVQLTANMRTKMENAVDLDGMIMVHQDYMRHMEAQCFLTAKLSSTHQAIISVLDLAILFDETCNCTIQKNTKERPSNTQMRKQQPEWASPNEEDSDTDILEANIGGEAPTLEKLNNINLTLNRLLSFVLAGVREACRSGNESSYELLCDKLLFGIPGLG